MERSVEDRRYFRVDENAVVNTLSIFNEKYYVTNVGVTKEDEQFMLSYSYDDGPREEVEEDRGYNHIVSVTPFALVEFMEILQMDSSVHGIKVVHESTDILVLYLNEDANKKRDMKEEIKDGYNGNIGYKERRS